MKKIYDDRGIQHKALAKKEMIETKGAIAFTIVFTIVLIVFLVKNFLQKIATLEYYEASLQFCFIVIVLLFLYGTLVYLMCRLGYWQRRIDLQAINSEILDTFFDTNQPARVSYIIPSYKEDIRIIKQTLLSAVLQEYPQKEVVLLIDNPPVTSNINDLNLLAATRILCQDVEALLSPILQEIKQHYQQFIQSYEQEYFNTDQETAIILKLLFKTALWFREFANDYHPQDHSEQLMIDKVFLFHEKRLHDLAETLEQKRIENTIKYREINSIYKILISIFEVKISSFERKVYENLSHKRNKAMNINTYISLMGKTFQIVQKEHHTYLIERPDGELVIDNADYVVILDADSIILPKYTKTLIYFMEQPENENFAVAQTPYCAYPNPRSFLERITAASTDVQHFIHQGSTFYNATYWVGANAMVRKKALHTIMKLRQERGFTVNVYIQDITVIEDTESTIDLIDRGWKLYSYPDILSYSATPKDFGSLCIQRERWANGGLIILPKLFKSILNRPKNHYILYEAFLRTYYLISPTLYFAMLFLLLIPFKQEQIVTLSASLLLFIPYYYLYLRDLVYMNYQKRDLLSMFALTLILLPINISGVLRSIHQIITGKHTIFKRTPKVQHTTPVPLLFILIEYGMCIYSIKAFLTSFQAQEWLGTAYSFLNFCFYVYGINVFVKYYPQDLLRIFSKYWLSKNIR